MSRRLALGCALALGGSAMALAGVTMRWYVIHQRGRSVSISGLGETVIEKVPRVITGADVASWSPAVAVLMVIASALAFLIGPRLRRAALALVIAGAPVLLYVWIALGDRAALDALPATVGDAVTASVQRGPGTLLMGFGVLIAVVGAVSAWGEAGRARTVRLPEGESPSTDGAGNDEHLT